MKKKKVKLANGKEITAYVARNGSMFRISNFPREFFKSSENSTEMRHSAKKKAKTRKD